MPIAKPTLDCLIAKIATGYKGPNVFNPWQDEDWLDVQTRPPVGAFRRRMRLRQHFDCRPRFLLIGEAPGYQGCHFSGVAFTNESLLLQGRIPRIVQTERITTRPCPWCEPSATIVWNQLHNLGIAEETVLWNAFAWHPHKPGEPMSNRAPTQQELILGKPVLKAVLDYFWNARVIAIGNVAEKALRLFSSVRADKVRHPSMGGANQFRQQLAELV